MRKSVVVGGAVVAALCVAVGALQVSSAAGYDRRPVVISGLVPDQWGQSITNAQGNLRGRYDGIDRVFCTGVIMAGFRKDSSWLHGTTRYWDKLACAGTSVTGTEFALIYDHKNQSAAGWKIYRLRGISISGLRG